MKKIAVWLVSAIVLIPLAFAADPPAEKAGARVVAVNAAPFTLPTPVLPLTLAAIFQSATREAAVTNGAHGMQIATSPLVQVLVARRNSDGTISTACVGNEQAAKRFFAAHQSDSPTTTQDH